MTFEERINQIEQHFKNISIEEFEKNLKASGIETIKPLINEDLFLATYEDLIYKSVLYVSLICDDNYFEDLSTYQDYELLGAA
jgi:hypothetical protein